MTSNKIYGLIGKELKHSFSPKYFKEKFTKEKILNTEYHLFSLNEIENVLELLKNERIHGLNVTIPYKESIIPFLNILDKTAKDIQAVNTIQIKKNKLIGFNTDVIGFEKSLKPLLKKHHKRALIFGNGGASKAVAFVLKNLEIPFKIVSRKSDNLQYSAIDNLLLKEFTILINTTPLGMFPLIESKPKFDYKGINENHLAYDLVYNPLETSFLKEAKKQGAFIKNGLEMLEIQAEESWKIWNKI